MCRLVVLGRLSCTNDMKHFRRRVAFLGFILPGPLYLWLYCVTASGNRTRDSPCVLEFGRLNQEIQ